MPFDENKWNRSKLVSFEEAYNTISEQFTLKKIEDEENAVAKLYKVDDSGA